MTLEESKKILKSEGFDPEIFLGVLVEGVKAASWEKIEVIEAMRVVAENGYFPFMEGSKYKERKARLKKEYEKSTKAPGSAEDRIKEDLTGNKSIEHFGEPIPGFPLSAVEGIKLRWKDTRNTSGNPALEEASSQFNDALLDEQGKKIAELTKENERLKDQVAILHACKKRNDNWSRKQIKSLGKEIARLNGIIHEKNDEIRRKTKCCCELVTENVDLKERLSDKDAVLSDVSEGLRLSGIREKNLTEVCQKYVREVEDLREQLANKVVDKIDAQSLKSAESALAYKEKVIEKLQKQLKYKSSLPSGSVEAINIYVDNISRARRGGFNKPVASTMDETELSETYEYGDKKLKYALHFNEDVSITFECSDPDRKNRHDVDGLPTPGGPKHDNSFKDFISKTIDNFKRRAAEPGCVGSNDGNGIIDQLFVVDISEEGSGHSGVIVACGKDFFGDAIKKMK